MAEKEENLNEKNVEDIEKEDVQKSNEDETADKKGKEMDSESNNQTLNDVLDRLKNMEEAISGLHESIGNITLTSGAAIHENNKTDDKDSEESSEPYVTLEELDYF